MNSNRDPLPPVNNALLPDIYNKLDAGTIEKTRVANTVLDIRLNVEQKVIAKYKREAERLFHYQKTSAVADLSRIAQKLPSEPAEPPSDSVQTRKKIHQKGYLTGRSDELICHRCYIHHLPTKKKFYMAEPKTPPVMFGTFAHQMPAAEEMESDSESRKGNVSPQRNGVWDWEARPASETRVNGRAGKVIAPIEKFKFLDRDLCGRERDLNDTLTPRLVPYEEWKKVVQNVCSQCNKKFRSPSRGPPSRRTKFSREKMSGRFQRRESDALEFSKIRRSSSTCTSLAADVKANSAKRQSPGPFGANSSRTPTQTDCHNKHVQISLKRQASDNQDQTQRQNKLQSPENSRSSSCLQREKSQTQHKHRTCRGDEGSHVISPSFVKQGRQTPLNTFRAKRS